MSAMRIHLLALTGLVLTTMPGCLITPKPQTPTLAGPDTGWTNTPTVFTATNLSSGGKDAEVVFDWGDSPDEQWTGFDTRYAHFYAEPGTYVAKCRVLYLPHFGSPRGGNWSNPCTVQIVPDTLLHPDSIYATVEFSRKPSWTCVLPNGDAVYVTSGEDSSVHVLDPVTNTCGERIPVQADPACCVASATGDRVYVANHGSNSISAIRTSDNTVADTISLGAAPDRLTLLPGDSLLYVSQAAKNRVSVIRLSNDTIIANIAVRDSPRAMSCTPDGQHVYVAGIGNDTLTVISTLSHTVERTWRVRKRPTSIVFSPSGETAYVACEGSEQVMLYRCSDFAKLDSLALDAQHLLMLPGGRCLYTISKYGMDYSDVRVYRRSDNFLLRNLGIGRAGGPSALPDGSRLYVPNGKVVTVLGPRPK
jgi:YVTN family beta-propeller protein